MNTSSKLDLASPQMRANRRVPQVLGTRPMSLDEPRSEAFFKASIRTSPVLPSRMASAQRSLF